MSIFERKPETIINIEKIVINLCEEKEKPHGVHLALITTLNNGKFIIMTLILNANQSAQGVLGLIDNVTQGVVQGTFAGTNATSDNEAIFIAVTNADGSVTAKAVAPGTGNLTVATSASYTDSNNQPQTQGLTITVPVTVAQATADSVSLTLTFGTPTAQ